ncbi:MAG: hypothetical protein KDJ22_06010 [Candidatus Competibacteraceae bacterium]|nr:hypothetical protein [Candidatus Competibacteraceae bacterium]MCP5125300.1 hypothetical protein [Gammaproteobacteria bacterium]HRX72134.1 hypothetical protein [Candidatus Competibacteraceae bacterium]
MAYSDFKNIDDIKQRFHLKIASSDSLFANIPEVAVSALLQETLRENIPLALNINTEKARSELMIAPVLVETRKMLDRKISLFSGIEFNVDESLNLTGYCDFILSQSPDQIYLEAPVACIVEAKNENIKSGYPQCMAEMIAAKLFNKQNATAVSSILGVVTTGSNWKFLKYQNDILFIDFDEYLVNQPGKLLGIFAAMLGGEKF